MAEPVSTAATLFAAIMKAVISYLPGAAAVVVVVVLVTMYPEDTNVIPAVLDEDGVEVEPERVLVLSEAWTEVLPAGDRYGFRYDQLALFLARGFEARLSALENN